MVRKEIGVDRREFLKAAGLTAVVASTAGTTAALLTDKKSRPLVPLLHVELHTIALGERAESITLDAGVVDEAVRPAALGRDESEPLRLVEPLDGPGATHVQDILDGVTRTPGTRVSGVFALEPLANTYRAVLSFAAL